MRKKDLVIPASAFDLLRKQAKKRNFLPTAMEVSLQAVRASLQGASRHHGLRPKAAANQWPDVEAGPVGERCHVESEDSLRFLVIKDALCDMDVPFFRGGRTAGYPGISYGAPVPLMFFVSNNRVPAYFSRLFAC